MAYNIIHFKAILKDLRLEMGIKQKDVATACDVSPQCISQLEAGTRNPTGSTLIALADFFNCSVDYLLGREENFTNPPKTFPATLSLQEKELLNTFKALPKELQDYTLSHIKKTQNLYQQEQPPNMK